MDKRARIRWFVLLSALAGTLAVIYWPVEGAVQAASVPSTARHAPPRTASSPAAGTEPAGADRLWEPGANDPFASRGWQAALPAVVAAAPAPVAPMAAAPPAGPPALPFQFVGQFKDGDQQLVYLGRGEQMLVAKNGEVLEQTYKVVSVGQTQIEFEHLPTGTRQIMPLPAPDH
ncbi:hypothetical protein MJ904_24185 [Massilia sp. MB5]|uniref:hypothetical protein n=1 Tax=Massilia sp. MB5 TaxID=2919578 RepID=UPI001F10910C|nr:hypothetical protein [Massilia sp. MB5]UMR30075.1 hypothetical protein MJ904_24185 [Massilia sp. MB5]